METAHTQLNRDAISELIVKITQMRKPVQMFTFLMIVNRSLGMMIVDGMRSLKTVLIGKSLIKKILGLISITLENIYGFKRIMRISKPPPLELSVQFIKTQEVIVH